MLCLRVASLLLVFLSVSLISTSRGYGEPVTISAGFHHLAHDLYSGPIRVLNDKQIEITGLRYDGKGPAAWFAVGNRGTDYKKERVNLQNITLIPDENHSCDVLQPYDGTKTIVLTLPGNLTIHDITFLVVFCVQFNHNFGYVEIPQGLPVAPVIVDNISVPALYSCPRKFYGKFPEKMAEVEAVDNSVDNSVAPSYYQDTYVYFYVPIASYLFNNFGTGSYYYG